MNAELLRDLRREFGTVSQETASSGVVAVRNKTARRRLAEMVGCSKVGGEVADLTPNLAADRWPRLVRVTHPVEQSSKTSEVN